MFRERAGFGNEVEDWKEVGGTGNPAFENSWANTGGLYETAAFRKDGSGRVYLKGVIQGGSNGTTAFTLPAGYRPTGDRRLLASVNTAGTGVTAVRIFPDGSVNIAGTLTGVTIEVRFII